MADEFSQMISKMGMSKQEFYEKVNALASTRIGKIDKDSKEMALNMDYPKLAWFRNFVEMMDNVSMDRGKIDVKEFLSNIKELDVEKRKLKEKKKFLVNQLDFIEDFFKPKNIFDKFMRFMTSDRAKTDTIIRMMDRITDINDEIIEIDADIDYYMREIKKANEINKKKVRKISELPIIKKLEHIIIVQGKAKRFNTFSEIALLTMATALNDNIDEKNPLRAKYKPDFTINKIEEEE